MTIDEAIKKYRKLSNSDRTCYPEEAAQIAKWLEELKAYKEKEFDVLKQDGQLLYKQGVIDGYDKAIYDFVEKATWEQIQYDCPLDMHDIEKIAEKLKEDGTDEKIRCIIALSGICPKCKTNSDMWIGRKCPNCGYIGIPINDE